MAEMTPDLITRLTEQCRLALTRAKAAEAKVDHLKALLDYGADTALHRQLRAKNAELLAEIGSLRTALRVNVLRLAPETSHADIDKVIEECRSRREPQPSIVCPNCGRRSYHPMDIKERYCAICGFHADIEFARLP